MFLRDMKDPDRFQKIAAGVQSCLIALGVIIGGGWTLFISNTHHQREAALADLEVRNRALREEASLRVTLEVKVSPVADTRERYLIGAVKILNRGTRKTLLTTRDRPIKLARVKIGPDGRLDFEPLAETTLYSEPGLPVGNMGAYPGTENSAPFAFHVDHPGLYFVSFSTPKNRDEKDMMNSLGSPADYLAIWGDSRFILVN